jgi:hypothetical protein
MRIAPKGLGKEDSGTDAWSSVLNVVVCSATHYARLLEKAAALLHFLRSVRPFDAERTLCSPAEVIQFNAGCDALRLALTDALAKK